MASQPFQRPLAALRQGLLGGEHARAIGATPQDGLRQPQALDESAAPLVGGQAPILAPIVERSRKGTLEPHARSIHPGATRRARGSATFMSGLGDEAFHRWRVPDKTLAGSEEAMKPGTSNRSSLITRVDLPDLVPSSGKAVRATVAQAVRQPPPRTAGGTACARAPRLAHRRRGGRTPAAGSRRRSTRPARRRRRRAPRRPCP